MSLEETTPAPPLEIVLRVDPGDLDRLGTLAEWRRMTRGRAASQEIEATCFDTPELTLLQEGLSLRVEHAGARRIQRLRLLQPARGGLFTRHDTETPVPAHGPDPELLGSGDAAALVTAALRDASLVPVLWIRLRRQRRTLERGDARIRADLEQGRIATARGSAPICELVLRLLSGGPGDLYAVALELSPHITLRPVIRDEIELAIARITGAVRPPVRAREPQIPLDATLEDLIESVLRSGLDQILENADAAAQGSDPEGVHQMRVGVRRLRSALTLFKKVLPTAPVAHLRDELRWLGGSLGAARDMDVFLDETLEKVIAARPEDEALKRLRELAVRARALAYGQVRETLDSPRHAALVLELGGWIARRGWREQPLGPRSARLFGPAREASAKLLSRRMKSVRQSARALSEEDRSLLHPMRIEVKKLRYAVDFLGSLFPGPDVRRFGRRLGRLQDVLGHLNDQLTADTLLAELIGALGSEARPDHHRAAGLVAGWATRGSVEQLARLEREWKSLRKARPFWKTETE